MDYEIQSLIEFDRENPYPSSIPTENASLPSQYSITTPFSSMVEHMMHDLIEWNTTLLILGQAAFPRLKEVSYKIK